MLEYSVGCAYIYEYKLLDLQIQMYILKDYLLTDFTFISLGYIFTKCETAIILQTAMRVTISGSMLTT